MHATRVRVRFLKRWFATGDPATAQDACEAARQYSSALPQAAAMARPYSAQAALAGGNLVAARCCADDAVSTTTGRTLMWALITRPRVAIAQGELEQAERDAHEALAMGAEMRARLGVCDILECLAVLPGEEGSHREAARLFAGAQGIRQRMGAVRWEKSAWGVRVSTRFR